MDNINSLRQYAAEHPDDADAFYRLGREEWRLGNRAKAISAYAAGAEIDPNGPCALALEQTRAIMAFYNKDLYNP